MSIEYDEKGKFFTDFISKEVVKSRIQTVTHHIQGYVHVRKGDRLSDEINHPDQFMAVTEAEIFSLDGQHLYTCDFLAVNRQQIVWLMPIEEQKDRSE